LTIKTFLIETETLFMLGIDCQIKNDCINTNQD